MTSRIKSSFYEMNKKKQYEVKVDNQLLKGLKPHVVEVTPRGRIDGACEGEMHGMTS
jgi:hypothetical protein